MNINDEERKAILEFLIISKDMEIRNLSDEQRISFFKSNYEEDSLSKINSLIRALTKLRSGLSEHSEELSFLKSINYQNLIFN